MNEQELEKKIDQVLAEAPDFHLPVLFADKLVQTIEARRQAISKTEFFFFVIGVLLFILAAAVSIALTDFKPTFDAFPFLNDHMGLILFGIVFIGLLNWVERKFLRIKPFW